MVGGYFTQVRALRIIRITAFIKAKFDASELRPGTDT